MQSEKRLLLSEINQGETATIHWIQGGKALNSRLASFGFTPGASINMTQNVGSGPLIVTVRGMRVALGRGEAARIVVERR